MIYVIVSQNAVINKIRNTINRAKSVHLNTQKAPILMILFIILIFCVLEHVEIS